VISYDITILPLKMMKQLKKRTNYTSITFQKIIEKIQSTSDLIEVLKLNDHEMLENEHEFSDKMKIL
jgi:hypothetical protein